MITFSKIKGWVKNRIGRKEYISKVAESAPWVYFSYIPYVYNHVNDKEFMAGHQNRQETVVMVDILNKLGYNVYLQDFTTTKKLPNIHPKIIIGLEPNFCRACKKYKAAKKIYFAKGAYYKHANRQIISMTDYINNKYNGHVRYKRLTRDHHANDLADRILQIGSSYTVKTYPLDIQSKIDLIDQSSIGPTIEKEFSPKNEYFFMASSGNVLKGLSLLLELFCRHKELTLNVVGPIEDDFSKVMKSVITPNIKFYGFVNMNSPKMAGIVRNCNFVIYPSGTEGGCPGSVINSMKMGLVPIVTQWAAFDGIEEVGYIIKDWTVASLEEGLNWSLMLSREQVEVLSKKGQKIVNSKFTLRRFSEQFESYIRGLK